ncbi:MAG: ATP-binding cassette domain-containing protein [Pseudomonadota bacterium]
MSDTHPGATTPATAGTGPSGADLAAALAPPGGQDMVMMDRAAPGWAGVLAWIFSSAMVACLVGLGVLALFVQDLVVAGGDTAMAPVLAALALVPALGLVILEVAQTRALAGYRLYRAAHGRAAEAAAGALAGLVLAFIHPLLGLPMLLGAVLTWGIVRLLTRASGAPGAHGTRGGEPLWDFLPAESVAILAGRDAVGLALARAPDAPPALLPGVLRALRWLMLALMLCLAGWLAGWEVLAPAAVLPAALITFVGVGALGRWAAARAGGDPLRVGLATSVTALGRPAEEASDDDDETGPGGLVVRGLSVTAADGWSILSEVGLRVAPGEILGIQGPPGAGKSMLMRALIAPQDLGGLAVRGDVRLADRDLWERHAEPRAAPAAWLPPQPLMLPTSGQMNLTFFETGSALERGRRLLEQMVFATDTVDKICAAPDATRLSGAEQKALGFARAFLLSPALYLLDRPEDGASDKLVAALVGRMRQEARAGRSFVLASENRAILDTCDKLLVLQDGRVVDFGPAEEIRARQSSGWLRFVGARALDTEENLETWVRSHFRRDGDEVNRRKACVVAAELLAFSCASAPPLTRQTLSFEFKHFEGHCLIKLTDRDAPVSTATLGRAREELAGFDDRGRMSPLATVMSLCPDVEATVENDMRVLIARLDTYDPRKTGGKPPPGQTRVPAAAPGTP